MMDGAVVTPEMLLYLLRTLLIGAGATIWLTAASLVVAVVLGFGLALMRLSDSKVLQGIARVYLEIFRNIPILTQLFVIYFGLSRYGIMLPATVAATLGFGLNGASMLSEVFRSAILSVDRGQREAGLAIGLTSRQAFRLLILPQAARTAIPPIGNYAIGLLKDTSLASAVAVPEIAMRAKMLVAETYLSTEIYMMVAVVYLALSLPLARLTALAERRFSPHRSAA